MAPLSPTFLNGVDVTQKIDNLPFAHAWVKPHFDGQKFNKIFIKDVRIDQLPEDSWKASSGLYISSKDAFLEEAQGLAEYFKDKLIAAFVRYPDRRLELAYAPGIDTISLEIAFTELLFSHPAARAGSLAVPVPGTGAVLSAISDPHVAFAAQLRDSSGTLVATAADRKFSPIRLLDLNKLTVTSSAREVCSIWATLIAEATNRGRSERTENRGSFSLLPW